MILRRYLTLQVFATSSVVVALLILIIMGGRLIKYFGIAAQGKMDVGILFTIIGFRMAEFLTIILPLGFFIGLMLVFGRLYVDNEMAVLNASGVSRGQLAKMLLPLTISLFVLQAFLMMFVSPWGNQRFDALFAEQAVRSGFDLVRPKEFISSGAYTIYAGELSKEKGQLKEVFFYQRGKDSTHPDVIIIAKKAQRVELANDNASIVDLYQGRRYSFIPSQARYTQAEFERYRLRIAHPDSEELQTKRLEAMSMRQLWQKKADPIVMSELGWRVFGSSVIILALLLATPLSQVSPRQGRYYRLFPAIMVFATLVVAMMAVKTRMTKGQLGVWAYPAVIGVYLVLAWFLARKQDLTPRLKNALKKRVS